MTWLVAIALFSAVIANLLINIRQKSTHLYNELGTNAHIIGTSSSALIINNESTLVLKSILGAFQHNKSIRRVCLYKDEKDKAQLFTSYINQDYIRKTSCPHNISLISQAFENIKKIDANSYVTKYASNIIARQAGGKDYMVTFDTISIIHPIIVNREVIGWVYIQQMHDLQQEFVDSIISSFFIIFVILIVCFFLSVEFQKIITNPIMQLVNTTRRVSTQRAYHLRVKKKSNDEIGVLVDSFNDMLSVIEMNNKNLLRAKEESERLNKMKSEFLSNMSHELRTPLHAIIGFSQHGYEQFEDIDSKTLKEYLKDINDSGQHLINLLNNLLSLSKLDSGKEKLEIKPVEISDMLDNCFRGVDDLVEAKNITIHPSYEAALPSIEIDPIKITQAITHLLVNSIKFTPEGKKIFIEVKNYNPDKNKKAKKNIVITVRDQGVGIPEDELDYIFDKFTQSSKTRTGAGGTGVGLSICKYIIELHGGFIKASNAQDEGAVFTIVLPVKQSEKK
ncbi:MAG: HAMP domain-containing histidine kinase [Rickettsiales bacterium]|nr:HAMP domain-containing histidine kinase [Rickettsiales bacterium]